MKLNGRGWKRWGGGALVAALGLALSLALAAAAAAQTTPADPTVEYSHTFTYTDGEQDVPIPAGLRFAQVEAIGGRGASKGTKAGGYAAKVEGTVEVEGLNYLYVLVGGNAVGENGGYNGGGGYGGSQGGAAVGGGGGGASDVRTEPSFLGESSLLSRLLVAAGGGGAGALANSSSRLNAAGGNAEHEGARAESVGGNNTLGSGGFGGHPGTSSAGGTGGQGGFPYASGTGDSGEDGHPGGLGHGGEGGQGPYNHPPGWGGGGGGGLYGGGGGGGGSDYTGGAEAVNTGGGGGGGGSNLVPSGGSAVIDEDASSSPMVKVEWAIPGTVIEGPNAYVNQNDPAYKLTSEEAGAEFECRLIGVEEPEWEPCEAEGAIPTIGAGIYEFEARAINEEGNVDTTPAKLEFQVETAPPVVIELNGPTETTETQPTFTFLGGSIIPVHFECAFDGAAPGPCSAERSDRPSSPLSVGTHTFTATPIDAAGNVGEAKSITFKVVGAPSPPPPAFTPKISLSGPKANARKGTATLIATVNGAGTVELSGAGVRPVSAAATVAGKVTLTIRPTAKARKQLRKSRKAKVKVTVTFTATAGGSATATKTVMLHLKPAGRHRGR